MKLLIADDEKLARQRLRALIQEVGDGSEAIVEAENGLDAVRQCLTTQADVVFLDIRMPIMDGIDAARELAQLDIPPVVIFVTAYDEHALQAFDSNALDYLLKPIRKSRLVVALEKAKVFNKARWQTLQNSKYLAGKTRSHICAPDRGERVLMPVAEIRYFQADKKYVIVRTGDREILIEEPLRSLEHEFSKAFIRVHRNALVALAYIQGLEKDPAGRFRVILQGVSDRIEVSRRHTPSIRALLNRVGSTGIFPRSFSDPFLRD